MRFALLAAALLAATLAGCAEDPAAGLLAPASHAPALSGTSTVTYVAYDAGGNPLADVDGAPGECAQDGVPTVPPESPVQKCTPASTTISVEIHDLPAPGSLAYSAWLSGGEAPARKVGDLAPDAAGHAVLNETVPEDLSGQFADLEVRLGDFVFAKAPASGTQPFTVVAYPVEVQSSFVGNELTLAISGLPEGASYTGRLYTAEGAATATSEESFPVQNGEVAFTAARPVAEYAEFHIHVGDSRINLHKETVQVQAAE